MQTTYQCEFLRIIVGQVTPSLIADSACPQRYTKNSSLHRIEQPANELGKPCVPSKHVGHGSRRCARAKRCNASSRGIGRLSPKAMDCVKKGMAAVRRVINRPCTGPRTLYTGQSFEKRLALRARVNRTRRHPKDSLDTLRLESCPRTWPGFRQPTSRLASVNRPPHDRRTLWRQRISKIAVQNRDPI